MRLADNLMKTVDKFVVANDNLNDARIIMSEIGTFVLSSLSNLKASHEEARTFLTLLIDTYYTSTKIPPEDLPPEPTK